MDTLEMHSLRRERLTFEQFIEFKKLGMHNIKKVFIVPPSIDFDTIDSDNDFGHFVVVYEANYYAMT
jgi:hypothetical protein